MERADPMGTKMDSKNAIFVGRTQGHWLAAEGLADVHKGGGNRVVRTFVTHALCMWADFPETQSLPTSSSD
jgi:hypothetical protein